jgi:Na+/H+ antiporter NhaA
MEAVVNAAQVCFLLLALWLAVRVVNHAAALGLDAIDQKPVVGRVLWLMVLVSGIVACLYGAGVL